MKLAFVELAGFRGFKHQVRFEFAPGFVVLTGRNGAGKSTVLDAIDFAFTGTIDKFGTKNAKGGGLDSHIWWVGDGAAEQHYVTVGLVDDDGKIVSVTRSRTNGLESNLEEIGGHLCSKSPAADWARTLMQTTLIRDETLASLSLDLPEQARFEAVRAAIGGLSGPDHSVRTGEILRAANASKTAQEDKVKSTQDELGRALSAVTEARSIAERQPDVADAEQIVQRLLPNLQGFPAERSEQLRHWVAERKQSFQPLMEAIARAEGAVARRAEFLSNGMLELQKVNARFDVIREESRRAAVALEEARRAAATEREADAYASHMIALLDHGEKLGLQNGHCPLCDAIRNDDDFAAAISDARKRLDKRGELATKMAEELAHAQARTDSADIAFEEAASRLLDLNAEQGRIEKELNAVAAIFQNYGLQVDPMEPEMARRQVLLRQEETSQLEHALFILEASAAYDKVTALESRTEHVRARLDEEISRLSAAERAAEAAKQIDNAAKSVANEILTEQFNTVMPLLKELYQRLRPHTDWKEIETDFGGKVRASLNFTVGEGRNPQFLFSSGQRRAAGLAFLLAIHLSRPWCQLRSLLLDDPVQHIDDYRALNLVEVLSAIRRTGRQVLVAVEDPALADLLCRRLRSTTTEIGRRFDLGANKSGSGTIEKQTDIFPLPREILQAEAS